MTSIETMRYIRMLLDDSRDWFPTTDFMVNMINEAQIRKVHEYYIKMDERALRPLYTTSTDRQNGNTITGTTPLLYPRAARMNKYLEDADYSVLARYVEPDLYFNYTPPGILPDDEFPRAAYYTITKQYNTSSDVYETYVWLSDTGARLDLLWIREPDTFVYDDDDDGNNVPLSLPAEYHHEVCVMAAELINIIDVGEMQRGMAVYQNQTLTLDKLDEA